MRYAVGYVSEITGQIVKRVFGGKDVELKSGDFIILGDHIWSRSLDSYAKILLHGGGILEMKPGMRVAIDDEYLSANDIKDFYTQSEIDELTSYSNKNDIEDSLLNTDIAIYNKTLDNPILAIEENSQNVYKSLSGEVNIMVKTGVGNIVELYTVSAKSSLAKAQIQQNGYVVFPIVSNKEYVKFDLYVRIADSSNTNEILRYDFVIEILQENLNKKNATEFEITIDKNFKDEISTLFKKEIFDLSKIRSIEGEQIQVDTKFYSNMKNPVFNFKINSDVTPKLFITGFNNSIFEDRYELKSHIIYNENGCFVVSDLDFEISGNYMFYVRYFNKAEGNALKEDFFSCKMEFENSNFPTIIKKENGKIFGSCKNSLAIYLFSVEDCVYTKISTTKCDANGNFGFNLPKTNKELFVTSIDEYGNFSNMIKV